MAIHPLPDTTVRAIGATQVLTDPAALVKELVDNALDAHATSVAVEIHHNTLDTIHVRDNGHGIAPEDRPLVARRYCTSKLANYAGLKSIGGSSLGFRGEALASAAELSGSLVISTRVEGQQVGEALKINQQGEVTAQDKASLTIGTCVKITDFLKANPVRRQISLKNSDDCLKRIKRCLQAYAFARPRIRYSLRVVKSKTAKSDWVYAPKIDANAEDAAIRLVGSDCASQCRWSVLEHEQLTFRAFLPRQSADASKIGGFGIFISVDSRPVSTTRGHFKQVSKIYREALKTAGSHLKNVKDAFLSLEINCPPGAYDINVEPAKDDVAFVDPCKVIEGIQRLFTAVYALSASAQTDDSRNIDDCTAVTVAVNEPTLFPTPHRSNTSHEGPQTNGRFDVGASGADSRLFECQLARVNNTGAPQPSQPRPAFRSTMYGFDHNIDLVDVEQPSTPVSSDLEEFRDAKRGSTANNPWILAKLNGSVGQSDAEQPLRNHEDALFAPTSLLRSQHDHHEQLQRPGPATPQQSSPPRAAATFHTSDHVRGVPTVRDYDNTDQSGLPAPQLYTPMPSSDIYALEDTDVRTHEHEGPCYDYTSTPQRSELSMGIPLSTIPDIIARPRRKNQTRAPPANNPYVPQFRSQVPRGKGRRFQTKNAKDDPRQRVQNWYGCEHGAIVHEVGDLTDDPRPLTPPRRNRDIRDFVGCQSAKSKRPRHQTPDQGHNFGFVLRNEPADITDLLKIGPGNGLGVVPASEIADLTTGLNSPENSGAVQTSRPRSTGERRALQALSTSAIRAREAQEDEEHRPHIISRAASRRRSSHKLSRTKSSMLPLERTPHGQGTQNLVLTTATSTDDIADLACKIDEKRSLLGFDQPAVDFDIVLKKDPPNVEVLTAKVHSLLESAACRTGNDFSGKVAADRLLAEIGEALAHASSIDPPHPNPYPSISLQS